MPDDARGPIESKIPELLELGFTKAGTYQFKPEPLKYYGSVFLSQSGTMVGTAFYLRDQLLFTFSTILESGRCVETGTIESSVFLDRFLNKPKITAVFATEQTVGFCFRRHLEKLAEIYWATADRPLVFELDQACDVIQYEGRVFS